MQPIDLKLIPVPGDTLDVVCTGPGGEDTRIALLIEDVTIDVEDPKEAHVKIVATEQPDRYYTFQRPLSSFDRGSAAACAIDALVLFADDPRLYRACGFQNVACQATWFGIHEFESNGLQEGRVDDVMMVKTVTAEAWPAGDVDLLGYLF
jgi:hypothetical protein